MVSTGGNIPGGRLRAQRYLYGGEPSGRTPPGRPGGKCQRRPLPPPGWEEQKEGREEKAPPSSAIQSPITSRLLGPNDHVREEGLLMPRMLPIKRLICLLSSAGQSSAQSAPEFQPKDTHPLTWWWVARKNQRGASRLLHRSKWESLLRLNSLLKVSLGPQQQPRQS